MLNQRKKILGADRNKKDWLTSDEPDIQSENQDIPQEEEEIELENLNT